MFKKLRFYIKVSIFVIIKYTDTVMIEKNIIIEDVDPVVFYGTNNDNLHFIKTLYTKLHIIARGNVMDLAVAVIMGGAFGK